MRMGYASVIVLVVCDLRVRSFKPEGDAPVAADPHGPEALATSFESMEHEARKVQVCGVGRDIHRVGDNVPRADKRAKVACRRGSG